MKTVSINVMNLCVPCENRCRYCLLSYDGKTTGVDYKRSEIYARRFYDWIKENHPDLSFLFGFGYSMEHPRLLDAIDFCRSIGSATGEFLQFDGMKFRGGDELMRLLLDVQSHGIKMIDLTFYGTMDYHDKFAARRGDYQLMMDTLAVANEIGLDVSVSIAMTHENAGQIDTLLSEIERHQTKRITCFIPHSEGRGRLLNHIRFSSEDYAHLSERAKSHFNHSRFKTEREWIAENEFPNHENRVLTVTLTPDNVDFFEQLDFAQTILYLEQLDDAYYGAIPTLEELVRIYGNPNNEQFFSIRDLYLSYQKRYIEDRQIEIYDINDERQCFSRRF